MNISIVVFMSMLLGSPTLAALVTPRAGTPFRYPAQPGSAAFAHIMQTQPRLAASLGVGNADIPVVANAMARANLTPAMLVAADAPETIGREMLDRALDVVQSLAQLTSKVGPGHQMTHDLLPMMREYVEAARLMNPSEKTAALVERAAQVEGLQLARDGEAALSRAREISEAILSEASVEQASLPVARPQAGLPGAPSMPAALAHADLVTPRIGEPVDYPAITQSAAFFDILQTQPGLSASLGIGRRDIRVVANAMAYANLSLARLAAPDARQSIGREMLDRANDMIRSVANLSAQLGPRHQIVHGLLPRMQEYVETARLMNPAVETRSLVAWGAATEQLHLQPDQASAAARAGRIAKEAYADAVARLSRPTSVMPVAKLDIPLNPVGR